MKKARKLSALLLALVMVFGLSVSAFAVESDQVTIKVYINGEEQADEQQTVTVGANATVESVAKAAFPVDVDSTWSGS